MKKSILFGALAFFAVSAMSIQDANAQNEEKAKVKKVESVSEKQEKAVPVKVAQEPVKKKDDCCAEKKVSSEKKADCCAEKKMSEKKDSKECCADKKMKEEKKNVKAEGKRVRPKDATKPDTKRTKKASVKSSKTEN
jgi:hypothetical protein